MIRFIRQCIFITLLLTSVQMAYAIDPCVATWEGMAAEIENFWLPTRFGFDTNSTSRPEGISIMSSFQTKNSFGQHTSIDKLKTDMLNEQFDYESSKLSMAGFFHPDSRTIFISEGHHRVAAAIEIAYETGNWRYFNRPIGTNVWRYIPHKPDTAKILPYRSRGLDVFRWRIFLNQLKPRKVAWFF